MFGFSVRIDLSWLVIMVLVVWSLAGGVFPSQYEGLHWTVYLAMGLVAAAGLFASIVFHELCHSLVARRYGLPMKGITLFIFGGVAEMSEEPPSAKAEFLMAAAGPLSSIAICLAFLAAAAAASHGGWPRPVVGVLTWIALINAILVGFNLIPGFPLDGGRMLRSALWHWKGNLRWATRIASRVGAVFGLILIGLGFANLLVLLNPLGGLWWIFVGMFVRAAAKQGYRQVLIRQALEGEPVRRFMSLEPVVVSPGMSLEDLVERYVYRYHHKMFPVVDGDRLAGCITTRQVRDIPRDRWAGRTVAEVAEPRSSGNTIGPDDDAMTALSRMTTNQVSRLMVVEGGELVGILSLKDLTRFLSLKLELEAQGGRPTDALEGDEQ
jgi:Zn-dependent protease